MKMPGLKKMPKLGSMMGKKKDKNEPAAKNEPEKSSDAGASPAPVGIVAPSGSRGGVASNPFLLIGLGLVTVGGVWFLTRKVK